MRVDEVELLHGTRHGEHLRLIEHREGVMCDGGRREQRGGYASKAEKFSGHDPLHGIESQGYHECRCSEIHVPLCC